MSKINVAIADNSANFRDKLTAYLGQQPDVEIAGVCQDGGELYRTINEVHPDVILMDIFMPVLDGITIIEKLHDSMDSYKPVVIIISSINNEVITNRIINMGVTYYMLKPVDPEILMTRIRQLTQQINVQYISQSGNELSYAKNVITPLNLEIEVTKIMRQVGIPAHIKGYQFIREAIILSIKDMEIINSVTKELYPSIAKTYSTTPSRVERAIRHAIESTWNKGYVKHNDKMFGYTLSTAKGKPTNAEFIALIADKLRLQYTAVSS